MHVSSKNNFVAVEVNNAGLGNVYYTKKIFVGEFSAVSASASRSAAEMGESIR